MGTRFITLTDLALYVTCPHKYYLHAVRSVALPPSRLAIQDLLNQVYGEIVEQAITEGSKQPTAEEIMDSAVAKSISSHAHDIMDIDFEFIVREAWELIGPELERRRDRGRDLLPVSKGAYVCDYAHKLKGTIPGFVHTGDKIAPVVLCSLDRGNHGPEAAWTAMGMGLLCRYAKLGVVEEAILYDPLSGVHAPMQLGDENKEKTKELLRIVRDTNIYLPCHDSCKGCEYKDVCEHYAIGD